MTHISTQEFERIMADPSAIYQAPRDVLKDGRLSHAEKIAVLKVWAFDERELAVAEEENMRGNARPIRLDQVMLALQEISK